MTSQVNRESSPLLEARRLTKVFSTTRRHGRRRASHEVRAVDDVDFEVEEGETIGLVGESGSGKSTLGKLLTVLERPTEGSVFLDGQQISELSYRELRPVRRRLQMVFQDPYGSLNPRMTVEDIVSEGWQGKKAIRKASGWPGAAAILERVGLSANFADSYPHQFSGGQRQRIGIARALAMSPDILVCDEPVSALDVSIQAQVINLLVDLQGDLGLTYVFIAHDLSVVRHISTSVNVMYLGRIVESGPTANVYRSPSHPYTVALLSAVPEVDQSQRGRPRILLPGDTSQGTETVGCRFRPRCWLYNHLGKKGIDTSQCVEEPPSLLQTGTDQRAACHFSDHLGEAERELITETV